MAFKVHTMKKNTISEKDKNQFIWEEFVLKNSIKKSNNSSANSNELKKNDSLVVEKLNLRPQAGIKYKPANQNNHTRKYVLNLSRPKIDIDIEKNKLKRIKSGKISIDGTMDLHGFSLKEAEVRLRHFVGESFKLRKRFLLIITEKGSNSKPNIHGKTLTIKSEVNNWLSDHFYNDKIQYISKALDRHGGEGAFYFFLKKSKNIFS